MFFKESDLVLRVSKNVNPEIWDEGKYSQFMDMIFKSRIYQKEATEIVLRYLNSGEYNSLQELGIENFKQNDAIRERFNNNQSAFIKDLGLPNRLSATVDMATGTGKSYVMYAIAAIMLAEKKVNKVLVLTPSVTIEEGLTKKFKDLSENKQLNNLLGEDFVPPSIINGDVSVTDNSIIIENRDAIYNNNKNRNSIVDSLSGKGEETLVLNDEVHHVFYSESNQWKSFIEDKNNNNINFKYIIGFTGTAYKRRTNSSEANEYFSDVIYRYSLREAIENHYIKDILYIDKADMPSNPDDRWKVILKSHEEIKAILNNSIGLSPITIVVSEKTRRADMQAKKFKAFLKKQWELSDEEVDKIVLCVHSENSAIKDRAKLKFVDDPGNKVEFIFSVSMLTEGWDVKRVFQIVPDEERAFNSKLLISQVLGRGLRVPDGWISEYGVPTVTVFNHEKWGPKVKTLVDELLDFKKSITVGVNINSEKNFSILNVKYDPSPESESLTSINKPISFLKDGYVNLPTDSMEATVDIDFVEILLNDRSSKHISYDNETVTVDEMAEIMYDRFLDLPSNDKTEHYQKEWDVERLKQMIQTSLDKSGNSVITKKLKNLFLNSMNSLFRENIKTVVYNYRPTVYETINTCSIHSVTSELSQLKRNKVLIISSEYSKLNLDDESQNSLSELLDTTNSYRYRIIDNKYDFKSPQYGFFATGEPEVMFVKKLISKENIPCYDSFIKSTDTGFYDFDYSWRKGTHTRNGKFNPDFFIKKGDVIIVVEIKDDSQIQKPDVENIGKYKSAKRHFELLNDYCREQSQNQRYIFTFLTPKNYNVFFEKLKSNNNTEFEHYKSDLDVVLSQSDE